jgi:hypothetical protein
MLWHLLLSQPTEPAADMHQGQQQHDGNSRDVARTIHRLPLSANSVCSSSSATYPMFCLLSTMLTVHLLATAAGYSLDATGLEFAALYDTAQYT